MNKEMKNCPYCGEEILALAKKCKHCGEWLDQEPVKEFISCPACGEDVEKGSVKCPHCKEPLVNIDKEVQTVHEQKQEKQVEKVLYEEKKKEQDNEKNMIALIKPKTEITNNPLVEETEYDRSRDEEEKGETKGFFEHYFYEPYIKHYFKFRGNMKREHFWISYLLWIGLFSVMFISAIFFRSKILVVVLALFLLLSIIPNIAMTVRRLRDSGSNPYVVLLGAFALFWCLKSSDIFQEEDNDNDIVKFNRTDGIICGILAALIISLMIGAIIFNGKKEMDNYRNDYINEDIAFTTKVDLEDNSDSISYAMGAMTSMQMGLNKEVLQQQAGIDSANFADFERGMREAIKVSGENAMKAYFLGKMVGMQLGEQYDGTTKQFAVIKDLKLSKDIFLKGVLDALVGSPVIEMDKADILLNVLQEKMLKTNKETNEKSLEENTKKLDIK